MKKLEFALEKQKPFQELTLKDIKEWKNIYATIIVIFGFITFQLLIEVYEYSLLTLISRIILIQVIVFSFYFFYENSKK
jgi:archaellum biogenesis protein FlaJ (TadC family)